MRALWVRYGYEDLRLRRRLRGLGPRKRGGYVRLLSGGLLDGVYSHGEGEWYLLIVYLFAILCPVLLRYTKQLCLI